MRMFHGVPFDYFTFIYVNICYIIKRWVIFYEVTIKTNPFRIKDFELNANSYNKTIKVVLARKLY